MFGQPKHTDIEAMLQPRICILTNWGFSPSAAPRPAVHPDFSIENDADKIHTMLDGWYSTSRHLDRNDGEPSRCNQKNSFSRVSFTSQNKLEKCRFTSEAYLLSTEAECEMRNENDNENHKSTFRRRPCLIYTATQTKSTPDRETTPSHDQISALFTINIRLRSSVSGHKMGP